MKTVAACFVALAFGCTPGAGPQPLPPDGGGGTTVGGATRSHVDVRLTDAPASFESVFVTISKTEVSSAGAGWITLSDQAQRFDLLALQNDATALLGGADLAPGRYDQLRLIVASASVVVGGVESPLDIASGAQTGIKINLDTDIAAGMTYMLVLDYDAAKSIKTTGHGFLMTPVIRVKSLTGTPISPPDAGTPPDAGMPPDAGPPDAGPPDAEPPPDAAPPLDAGD